MADNIVIKAISGNDILNGSMITFVQETGTVASASGSLVNQFVPTGTIASRLHSRFDGHSYPRTVNSGILVTSCIKHI